MATVPTAGISSFFYNGLPYTITEVSFNPTSYTNEWIENQLGDFPVKYKAKTAMCKATFVTVPGVNPLTFQGTNGIVLLLLRNGLTFNMYNAVVMDVGDVNPIEGTFEVDFQAATATLG